MDMVFVLDNDEWETVDETQMCLTCGMSGNDI